SMQGHNDVRGFVRAFTGSHRYVLDYLAEEILYRQPATIRDFLLKTSVLTRLHGPLCDALLENGSGNGTGTEESQALLEQLEQAHLFIIPLDDERRWYRYHHLFADVLREQLQKSVTTEVLDQLHQRASRWYTDNGYTAEAINHALAAGDFERAISLIEPASLDLLTHGAATTVINWLAPLPAEIVQTNPRLSLSLSWAYLILGKPEEEIGAPLADAKQALNNLQAAPEQEKFTDEELRGMWGEVDALRSMILADQGRLEEAIAVCEQALTQIPPDATVGRSILKSNLGMGYLELGRYAKASKALSEAITLAKQSDNLMIILSASNALALLNINQGRLADAYNVLDQARQFMEDGGADPVHPGHPSFLIGRIYLGLADILRELNALDRAKDYLKIGVDLAAHGNNFMSTNQVAQIIQARILQVQGDEAAAADTITQAVAGLEPHSPVFEWCLAVQARLWLAQNNLPAAIAWANSGTLPLDEGFTYIDLPGEYATLVRVYIAEEKFDEAATLLDRMEAIDRDLGRWGRLLEDLILRALLRHAQGETQQALEPLAEAIPIAERGGYMSIFLEEGAPINGLLRKLLTSGASSHRIYLNKVLDAFVEQQQQMPALSGAPASGAQPGQKPPAQPLIEPLSDRELEVLNLIANGLSNQEIGESLVIAEGTVKKHIHNIFGKLGVRRRTQVVLRARELGLL
ncbi:MAG: LuxR C-terminal-related transcriptional regulator, partial [Anaerolineae bacterium]|nr:LuxR C-terminal-related transcriptional regulator [Anaerolineae bacterium]